MVNVVFDNDEKIVQANLLGHAANSQLKNLNPAQFHNVIHNKGLTVIDFYADWCPPCRRFMPIVQRVADKSEGVEFYKINIDAAGGRNLKEALGIGPIPTLLFYRDGQLVHKSVGSKTEAELTRLVQRYSECENFEARSSNTKAPKKSQSLKRFFAENRDTRTLELQNRLDIGKKIDQLLDPNYDPSKDPDSYFTRYIEKLKLFEKELKDLIANPEDLTKRPTKDFFNFNDDQLLVLFHFKANYDPVWGDKVSLDEVKEIVRYTLSYSERA